MAELIFSGGLNENDDITVDPRECTAGQNFRLGTNNTRFRPRKPFDLVDTATNAASVNGIMQFIKRDGTKSTLVQAGAVIYDWDGVTFTSKSDTAASTPVSTSKLRMLTWSLDDYSIITDLSKATVVKKWDGTTVTTLTTGLGSDMFAKYGIVHQGRVWLFNVKSGTDTPHLMVASKFEDPTVYDTTNRAQASGFSTGNEAFFMAAPNLLPFNGVSFFKDKLIISTKDPSSDRGMMFELTGSDSLDYAWKEFYTGSASIGDESMISVGDDIDFMRQGGAIESLRATEAFGDVKTDDLSRWIRTTTEDVTDSIAIYDQTRQKVYFFDTANNKVLVMHKDMLRTGLSPWSVYKTLHSSNFSATAVTYMKSPVSTTSDEFVYWGDADGNVYQMEGTGLSGDGGTSKIRTHRRSTLSPTVETDTISGRVEYRRVSAVILNLQFEWTDDYGIAECACSLNAPPDGDYWGGEAYFGGEFYFNAGNLYSRKISTKGFSPVGRGSSVYIHTLVETVNDFDVIKLRNDQQRQSRQAIQDQAG